MNIIRRREKLLLLNTTGSQHRLNGSKNYFKICVYFIYVPEN